LAHRAGPRADHLRALDVTAFDDLQRREQLAARPLFTPELATAADRAFIEEMIAEDMVAYEAIVKKLDAQDGLSIPGRVFA